MYNVAFDHARRMPPTVHAAILRGALLPDAATIAPVLAATQAATFAPDTRYSAELRALQVLARSPTLVAALGMMVADERAAVVTATT